MRDPVTGMEDLLTVAARLQAEHDAKLSRLLAEGLVYVEAPDVRAYYELGLPVETWSPSMCGAGRDVYLTPPWARLLMDEWPDGHGRRMRSAVRASRLMEPRDASLFCAALLSVCALAGIGAAEDMADAVLSGLVGEDDG